MFSFSKRCASALRNQEKEAEGSIELYLIHRGFGFEAVLRLRGGGVEVWIWGLMSHLQLLGAWGFGMPYYEMTLATSSLISAGCG